MLTRRHLLLSTPMAALAAKKTPPLRPNIVLILTDNLGAWMLGCYGNQEIKTPNLDELSRTGMRLQHAFVYTPEAALSRTLLLTGITQLLPPSGYQFASPNARRAASIAFGEGPSGFSFDASFTA